MARKKPIKIEAYRCPKCSENLQGSYRFAVQHVKTPIVKIPEGVIIKLEKFVNKDNKILPSPTYCIPVSSKVIYPKILRDHSVEQGAIFIQTRYFNVDDAPYYFLDSYYNLNRFHRLNSKEIITRLQEKRETKNNYKHLLLTEEEFDNFLSDSQHGARSRGTPIYEEVLRLSGLKKFKRTTPGLEKLINKNN